MKNESAHFTPQQISKLINLHIKTHQCLAVKCQNERQQLLNTIEKLARNFYDIYKMHENQKRQLNKIINLYNDFCTQFGLPAKIEKTKQHEFNHMDKIAQMIYEHFIKMREVNGKNKTPQNFEKIKHTIRPTVDLSAASSSSSVVEIDHEENSSNKMVNQNGNETDNGKRSLNSVLVNIGSISATNSFSPPDRVLSKYQHPKNDCSDLSKIEIGRIQPSGNQLNASVCSVPDKNLKRHTSAEKKFGAPSTKMRMLDNFFQVTEPHSNGSMSSAASTSNNARTNQTIHPTTSFDKQIVSTPKNLYARCSTGFPNKRLPECDNKNRIKNNSFGGTVYIKEGRELSIALLSSPTQPFPENVERPKKEDNVIQLDDDD